MRRKIKMKKTTNANNNESTVDVDVRIRCRAYELYERRGREDGREIEDWLQAEAELAGESAKPLAGAVAIAARKPPVANTGKTTAKRVKKPRSPAQTKTSAE
jgi:hypothetical protein